MFVNGSPTNWPGDQQVRSAPEASAELEDAARWYEQRHVGLCLAFLAAVDVAVDFVARSPGAGAPVAGLPEDLDVRRAPVSRFPYHLAYLVTTDQIHLLAWLTIGTALSTGAVEPSSDGIRSDSIGPLRIRSAAGTS